NQQLPAIYHAKRRPLSDAIRGGNNGLSTAGRAWRHRRWIYRRASSWQGGYPILRADRVPADDGRLLDPWPVEYSLSRFGWIRASVGDSGQCSHGPGTSSRTNEHGVCLDDGGGLGCWRNGSAAAG